MLSVPLAIVAVLLAWFVSQNPFIFGRRVDTSGFQPQVTTQQATLDAQLNLPSIRNALAQDYDRYRNHCLRVYTFSKYFLPESVEQEMPNALKILAVALAYHDIALWTDGRLDYLDPSVQQMDSHVSSHDDNHVLSPQELEIAGIIIEEHHKVTSYSGGNNETVNALVNAARKADWADFTFGIVSWGLPTALLQAAYDQVPELGFHVMLAKMGSRLSPHSLVGRLAVLKIFKW
jgi:hypothetical protein